MAEKTESEKRAPAGSRELAENIAGLLRKVSGFEDLRVIRCAATKETSDVYGLALPVPKVAVTRRLGDGRIEANGMRFIPDTAFILVGRNADDRNKFVIQAFPEAMPRTKQKAFFNMVTAWSVAVRDIYVPITTVAESHGEKLVEVTTRIGPLNADDRDDDRLDY